MKGLNDAVMRMSGICNHDIAQTILNALAYIFV